MRRILSIAQARRICISIITIIKHFVLFSLNYLIKEWKTCLSEFLGEVWKAVKKLGNSAGTPTAFLVVTDLWLFIIAFLETMQIFSFRYLKITDNSGGEWSRKENIQYSIRGIMAGITFKLGDEFSFYGNLSVWQVKSKLSSNNAKLFS